MSESVIDLTESSPPLVEQARTPSAKAVLQSAIDTAQPARLRGTLLALCNASAEAASLVSKLLLIPESEVKRSNHRKLSDQDSDDDDEEEDGNDESSNDSEEEDENDAEGAEATATSLKRLRSRFAMCENCSEEFDVADNEKGACAYHDEEAEPDDEAFADHDENCHGPIDSSENREAYPEYFIYTCCDQNMLSEGCKTGRHVEEKVTYKRPRY